MMFLKEFLYDEARGEACRHFQEAGLHVTAAGEERTKEMLYDIGRLEFIGNLRHAATHVLLVNIILVFQVAYRPA